MVGAVVILSKKMILLYIVAILAFVLMFWFIGIQQVFSNLQSVNILILIVAALIQSFSILIRGIRWKYILSTSKVDIGTLSSYSLIYVGWFANGLVPARIGDFVRALAIKKENNCPLGKGIASLVTERILDIAVIIALMTLFLLLVSDAFGLVSSASWINLSIYLGVFLAFALVAFVILCIKKQSFITKVIARALGSKYADVSKGFAQDLSSSFSGFLSRKKLLVVTFVLSVFAWILDVPKLYLVYASIDLYPSILAIGAAGFITNAWSMVPITPGGIGSVEIGETLFVVWIIHLSAPQAAAVVLLDRIISFYVSMLIGGIISIKKGVSLTISRSASTSKPR